jgi:M6 family metalloprotease-like protein
MNNKQKRKVDLAASSLWLMALILMLMASVGPVYAGPASPDPVTVTNPDGTKFKVYLQGDEFQNWIETGDGYTVVQNNITGYWEYAEKASDGQLVNSGVVYTPGVKAPDGIKKGLKPERNTELESFHKQMLKEIYQERMSSARALQAEAEGWPPVPVSGAKKVLIILINFADRTLITTASGWYDKIFNTTAGVKSMANFYSVNSYGLMSISPASHSQPGNPAGIITVTVSDNHPNYGKNYTYGTETTILNHALTQAAPYINFASYDSNSNGILEQSELNIYFIYAGYEASGTTLTPNVWAHAWGGTPGIYAGTKEVHRWAQNGELNDNGVQHPMGVIAHEMGHSLCGLPDLYDTSSTNAGLGYFSLMASGSWGGNTGEDGGTTPVTLDAWSRQYLGWSTPVTPSADGSINFPLALSSRSSSYKFVFPEITDAEYFLAENRYPTGWDLGLIRQLGSGWTGGLLILHVDTNIGTPGSNNINRYVAGSHQGVMAEEAQSSPCSLVGSTCRGNALNLFYSGNNDAFTDSTTPGSKYYDGTSTNFGLTSISTPGTTMSAYYSRTTPETPVVIVSNGFEMSGWYYAQTVGTTAYWYYATGSSHPAGISPYGGSNMALFNSYTATSGDQARLWLDTSFPISAAYSAVTLSFWMYHDTAYPGVADRIQPQISTNGGSSWTDLGSPVYRYDGTTGWAEVTRDLSAYRGQSNVLIGFLGISGYGNDIHIDEMVVSGTASAQNVLIGATNYYQTLTAAYAAASTGNVIKARNIEFDEALLCGQSKNVTFNGGYGSGFVSQSGYTTLHGSLTIRYGSVKVNRLIIK